MGRRVLSEIYNYFNFCEPPCFVQKILQQVWALVVRLIEALEAKIQKGI